MKPISRSMTATARMPRNLSAEYGDNSYVIRNIRSDKVLDITRGVAENGTNIQQYSYEGLSDQRWFLEPSGDGYAIVTRVSMLWGIPEMVLDVAGEHFKRCKCTALPGKRNGQTEMVPSEKFRQFSDRSFP